MKTHSSSSSLKAQECVISVVVFVLTKRLAFLNAGRCLDTCLTLRPAGMVYERRDYVVKAGLDTKLLKVVAKAAWMCENSMLKIHAHEMIAMNEMK